MSLFQAIGGGLKWGEEFPNLHQIKIVDDKPDSIIIINGHHYKGPIYVYDVQGNLSIVNKVPIEDYVISVLGTTIDEQLELETLCALAIVARTNAYYQALSPKNKYWAIDAQDINYQGFTRGTEEIDAATRLTKNMVMSRTGVYEGVILPFPAQFDHAALGQSEKNVIVSKISIQEANAMAKQGEHAAQILGKAFPGSIIMLMYQ